MPKMTATIGAMHLGPGQVRGAIRALDDRIWQRLEEARPAGPTLELRFRAKQPLIAAGTDKHATAMLVVERTCERSFLPSWRRILYSASVSLLCHSASVRFSGNLFDA